jgi:phenylalanyl-tRNA synthetase alpha chain
MGELDGMAADALARIAACSSIVDLDEIRVHWLGKKGVLTEQLKSLGTLPAAERPSAGARINTLKVSLHAAIEARRGEIGRASCRERVSNCV